VIVSSQLRRFGHFERKDDIDWVTSRVIMMTEVNGTRQRGSSRKIW